MTQRPKSHLFGLQNPFILLIFTISLSIFSFLSGWGCCQEIMIDKLEKCGDLTCFPTYDDNNTFYYLPDHPRIAMKNGRPQFSFMKYARVKETGKAGINRAEGGGIVHFLIEYGVTPERVARAEAALKKRHKNARIAGPVMYRRANFALVTTFNKENKEWTKIVSMGKAPLMEGDKAAVSIALTREGAEILWQNFKLSTPDISVHIEAEYEGIKKPYDATLIIDWAKVNMNHHIGAGGTYKWFGADIDILLRELRQDGAVRLEVKGKDKDMDAAWKFAQDFLISKMFEETPIDKQLQKEVTRGRFPNLEKALSLSKRGASKKQSLLYQGDGKPLTATLHLNQYPEIMAALKALAAEVLGIPEAEAKMLDDIAKALSIPDYDTCMDMLKQAKKLGYPEEESTKALECFKKISGSKGISPKHERNIKKAIKLLEKKIHKKKEKGSTEASSKTEKNDSINDSIIDAAMQAALSKEVPADKPSHEQAPERQSEQPAHVTKQEAPAHHHKHLKKKTHPHRAAKHRPRRPKPKKRPVQKDKGGKGRAGGLQASRPQNGPIGLLISYRLRRLKKSGIFRLSMKRYAATTRFKSLNGNVGDLYSRYGHDPKIFRAVLIDDPVYKQREILITLDGQDAETFSKHVNFVTVQMRKVHESGEITRDEIAITPDTFNNKSNLFEFIYGYKGDRDRDAWLKYEARDIWSFAGGITVEHGWKQHSEAMLSVASPVRYRSISIEAEGERLTKAGVRHGVIELFSTINGKELREEVSIRNSGPAPIKVVDIPVTDEAAPEYAITWYLNDGSRIQGERQTLQGDILYWDIVKGEKK